MRTLRRVLTVLALLVASLAISSSMQPAFAVCEGDAPVPAAPGPYQPHIVSDDDPFSGDASIESVYGTTPRVWNYDNGCSPGAGIMPSVGAALANLGFEVSGALAGWTHALLEAVIAPDWAAPLDAPVAAATQAVADGTWTPWLVVMLTLVAVMVLLRSREGYLGGAITATLWALLILIAVSWTVSYPTEAVRAVDQTVRTAVVQIGNGFSETSSDSGPDEDQALRSVDQQMDAVVRTVQYRTWLKAAFGDPDSEVAEKYGPRVYRATHFTWEEWQTYQNDPDGKGKELREEKQEQFETLAEEIKEADPVAYRYFTGSEWGSRIGASAVAVLVMTIVCAFLLLAGLFVLAAFAVVRLLVPFTPALGVVFLLDIARERAIEVFRRVGGVLVMGPVYFMAGLVLLRFYGELLTADIPFLLRVTFVLALSVIAWRLLKPASALRIRLRGLGVARRHLKRSASRGSDPAQTPVNGESAPHEEHATRRGPVYGGDAATSPTRDTGYRTRTPATFVEHRQLAASTAGRSASEEYLEPALSQSAADTSPRHGRARVPSGAPASQSGVGPAPQSGISPVRSGHGSEAGADGFDGFDRRDAAWGDQPVTDREFGRGVTPRGSRRINEANLTTDERGNRVFVIYTHDQENR